MADAPGTHFINCGDNSTVHLIVCDLIKKVTCIYIKLNHTYLKMVTKALSTINILLLLFFCIQEFSRRPRICLML